MKYLPALAIVFPMLCYADNVIRVQAPISQSIAGAPSEGSWIDSDPVLSAWSAHGEPTSCSAWAPGAESIANGQLFQQNRSCLQAYQRTHQAMVVNTVTGAMVANGDAIIEYKQEDVVAIRNSYGVKGLTCRYLPGSDGYGWSVNLFKNSGNYLVSLRVNGNLIHNAYDKNSTTAHSSSRVIAGKTYRMGEQVSNSETDIIHYKTFEICY